MLSLFSLAKPKSQNKHYLDDKIADISGKRTFEETLLVEKEESLESKKKMKLSDEPKLENSNQS